MQKKFFENKNDIISHLMRLMSFLFSLLLLLQRFGPGVGEGVCADAFLLFLFAHIVLDVAFGGGVAFFS